MVGYSRVACSDSINCDRALSDSALWGSTFEEQDYDNIVIDPLSAPTAALPSFPYPMASPISFIAPKGASKHAQVQIQLSYQNFDVPEAKTKVKITLKVLGLDQFKSISIKIISGDTPATIEKVEPDSYELPGQPLKFIMNAGRQFSKGGSLGVSTNPLQGSVNGNSMETSNLEQQGERNVGCHFISDIIQTDKQNDTAYYHLYVDSDLPPDLIPIPRADSMSFVLSDGWKPRKFRFSLELKWKHGHRATYSSESFLDQWFQNKVHTPSITPYPLGQPVIDIARGKSI
jgi:hypothetical protein